eukprot:gene583-10272_t
MDRFVWASSNKLEDVERVLAHITGVRIYDGENKTHFDNGSLMLTNFRLIWDDTNQQDRTIALPLALVVKLEEESAGLFRSAKTLVFLHRAPDGREPGPAFSSPNNHVKLSFRSGGQSEFHQAFLSAISKKEWNSLPKSQQKSGPQTSAVQHKHAGIGGIQRKMEEKYRDTDQSINKAFKDLDALMEKAKEMVDIAEKFCSKLQDKQVSITDDETVEFKSYLLSMGIANPVTRETHGTGVTYHEELAKQLASFLKDVIEKEGGVMTLTEVYCRFNRARGMELVSPEDLVNAAKQFERLKIPLRFHQFESGVLVIQSSLLSEADILKSTTEMVEMSASLTSEEFAQKTKVAVALAKERLLSAEKAGKLCRDDSLEGLRFYPNKFLIA